MSGSLRAVLTLAGSGAALACGCSAATGPETAPPVGWTLHATDVPRPSEPPAPEPEPVPPTASSTPVAPEPPEDGRQEVDPGFPPETRSLEVKALAHVKQQPHDRARYIGKITRGTRVGWNRVVAPDEDTEGLQRRKGRKPCPAWVEIEPVGYLCQTLLQPSTELPEGVRQPVVPRGRLTPDAYFKVTQQETAVYESSEGVREDVVLRQLSTKVMVIGYGVSDIDGVEYRKTDHGLVDAAALRPLWPSRFEGRALDDPESVTWPFGWVYFEPWSTAPFTRAEPDRDAERVRRTKRREVVSVVEERDGFLRIADGEWIERRHVRLARLATPPPGVDGSAQWVDVDLDEQVLVAYEGPVPVFATLVSTGASRHPTPTATYRVRAKAATTPMAGDPDAPNRYEVSGVPWAVRFADGLYIHGAYWHDGFGSTRSHGCVNVAPRDAAHLYEWLAPRAPSGWSEVEVPMGTGPPVRIHDRQHPDPDPYDYRSEEPWHFSSRDD